MALSFFTPALAGFPRDVFAELDRLARDVDGWLDTAPGIRGTGRSGFPALNVGTTPTSVEIYLFAPGVDPSAVEVSLDRGVLTIDGERLADPPAGAGAREAARPTVHAQERVTGRFRRVVSLPDDIDPDGITAAYRDGVLHVSVRRREAAQPRRIAVS